MRRATPPTTLLIGPLMALCALVAGSAAAQSPSARLYAQVDQTQVKPGETITYRLTLEYVGNVQTGAIRAPDWGGLVVRSQPSRSRQISTINGRVQVSQILEWPLLAPNEGTFRIGSASMDVSGQTLQTDPITVTARAGSGEAFPPDLRGEPILSARTSDPDLNKGLEGRLFLRMRISDTAPYVSEPVIIDYTLYNDRIENITRLSETVPEFDGALVEVLRHPGTVDYEPVDHNGRKYNVAPMYRAALVPLEPGERLDEGYRLQGMLNLGRQRRDPFFDDFFFGRSGIALELPSPPIRLNVRPLPRAGQPTGFTGTVGQYMLTGRAEPAEATTDDLVTLRLELSGIGAIELANPPRLPAMDGFEVVGQSESTEKKIDPQGIGGIRTFEYVLRPTRTGNLRIPAIGYAYFDPAEESYQQTATQPIEVRVRPGSSGLDPAVGGNPTVEATQDPVAALHYLKPVHRVMERRTSALMASTGFWTLNVLALILMAGSFGLDRWRAGRDPAEQRRAQAGRRFERAVRQIRRDLSRGGAVDEIARRFDSAVRNGLADRHDLAPEGLTHADIRRLLTGHALAPEQADRLVECLESCAAQPYSPQKAGPDQLREWMDEATRLLRKGGLA